jgi:L-ascorbate metabolism protein UlaG (beta-lactamase superfamily)
LGINYHSKQKQEIGKMELTWLDSNSWLIELGGKRILLDPWLVGDLTFGNLTWLFQGRKTKEHPIPENIDLILLSQGLPDHAHPPTLAALDRGIPVVGSGRAAKVVREMGYQQVVSLNPGETHDWQGIKIQAVPGSPVGPGTPENGYILRGAETSLYYEPHGYHDPSLKEMGPIEVIITPTINLNIPFIGPVIKGQESAVKVCEMIQPRFLFPTAAGGDVSFEGLLLKVLSASGDTAELQQLLKAKGLSTEIVEPEPWKVWSMGVKV